MSDFYLTVMGRRFYEGTLPRLVAAVERVATVLESADVDLVRAQNAALERRLAQAEAAIARLEGDRGRE